jgi:hypothetical protein
MAQEEVKLTPLTPPQQIIIQQPPTMFGRFGKWLLAALAIAVLFIIGLYSSYHSYFSPPDAPQEKYHSLARYAAARLWKAKRASPRSRSIGSARTRASSASCCGLLRRAEP